MKQLIKRFVNRFSNNVAWHVIKKSTENTALADSIAFPMVLETMLTSTTINQKPNELFYGISDNFWFWLNTEGVRRNPMLRNILPGVPDETTQLNYNGGKGDATLGEAFEYYKLCKELYKKYKGDIGDADKILDFGCGWGRVIRFYIKDLEPSKVWGCDPVPEVIELCKRQNKWCHFELIDSSPPSTLQENTFDLIYSFSVFSHLSEDLHLSLLAEIKRILKPGGIYITTTRNRMFIEDCARLRKGVDRLKEGPNSSPAFPDTKRSLAGFDQGLYTHHSYQEEGRPYWGETLIPKKYVVEQWGKHLNVLDYLERNPQNVIIVQKPL